MRYVVNTIDGTITDAADTVIVDIDLMTPEQYDLYLAMTEDEQLVDLAKVVGVPV